MNLPARRNESMQALRPCRKVSLRERWWSNKAKLLLMVLLLMMVLVVKVWMTVQRLRWLKELRLMML